MPFQEQFAVNFSDRLNREPLDRRLYAISVGPPKQYDGAGFSALQLADPLGVLTEGDAAVAWAGCHSLLIRTNALDLMETIPGTSSALTILQFSCGSSLVVQSIVKPSFRRFVGAKQWVHTSCQRMGRDGNLNNGKPFSKLDRCLDSCMLQRVYYFQD